MTIRHLKVFVAVCKCGSITGAAEQLFMTQPAVSLVIKELEKSYSVKLFDRIRHLQITEDGKRLLKYALSVTEMFDAMEQAMKAPDTEGEIRIGCSLTIGACLLPRYTKEFVKKLPGIRAKVFIDNSDSITKGVSEGKYDIGLVETTAGGTSLATKPFMEDSLCAICPREHPFRYAAHVSLDEFLAQPLLLRERGSGGRELFESAVTMLGRKLDPLWESISTTALIRAVEASNGVSVLPYRLVKSALEAGSIGMVPLDAPLLKRSFSIIHHRSKYLSDSMKVFMSLVLDGCSMECGIPAQQK